MKLNELYRKALNFEFLSVDEGLFLFENAPTSELAHIGNTLRKRQKPGNKVGWIIDRNVNTTNACVASCQFCNFYRVPGHKEEYITTLEQYKEKIEVLFAHGGQQILLQGGHHPKLKLDYYAQLFRDLKSMFPNLKLHALGPPEIHHISVVSKTSYEQTLLTLVEAGLDSLPGAGAEILDNAVRKQVSRGKCSADEWLEVMRVAHRLDITTSATMMFGHVETHRHRIEHLAKLRAVQAQAPDYSKGFTTFIPWPYMDEDTELRDKHGVINQVTADEYLRMIAISRIMLPNIKNIQASWLTVGKTVGQLSLHAGANDFGSIMIEENVVSAAGADHWFDAESIQAAIREAGFEPMLRNQRYEPVEPFQWDRELEMA